MCVRVVAVHLLLQAVQTILRAQATLPNVDSSSWMRSLSAVTTFLIRANRQNDVSTLLSQAIAGQCLDYVCRLWFAHTLAAVSWCVLVCARVCLCARVA